MPVTQRGQLNPDDEKRLLQAKAADEKAAQARDEYRAVVLEMMAKSSYREVARITGLSTNTLINWKNAAKNQ